VYLAEDVHDPQSPPVAIKELLDAPFTSPHDKQEAVTWFKREVSILLSLEHPSIPMIHGYWTAHRTAGPFYLAMDYIPGKTLETVLQAIGGRVRWPAVVAWGAALCDVLAYLHGRTPPFVFRDLKLSNVMLDNRTGQPVLIDFGITRQIAAVGGTAIGTWGYVPYEQILGKAEPRSDVYALGTTLHTLLTGRHPDAEYTRLQRTGLDVEATLRALFPAVDSLVPDVPQALAHVPLRATAFAPADRFPSAAAMAAALRQVTSPAATVVVAAQPLPAPPTTAPVVAPPQPLPIHPARTPVIAASTPSNLIPSAQVAPPHVPQPEKLCVTCGNYIHIKAEICPRCGVRQPGTGGLAAQPTAPPPCPVPPSPPRKRPMDTRTTKTLVIAAGAVLGAVIVAALVALASQMQAAAAQQRATLQLVAAQQTAAAQQSVTARQAATAAQQASRVASSVGRANVVAMIPSRIVPPPDGAARAWLTPRLRPRPAP
jgi:serine/threonine protein kinase